MKDQLLKKLLANDQVGTPDPGIHHRLNQAFLLKSATYHVKQNSFAGFAAWLFSWNGLALKTTLAAVFVAFFLFNPNVDINSGSPIQLDSTRVTQSLQIDSAVFMLDSKSPTDSILL
ncbi:hypothetical protein ACUNWD_09035 [Sunxiuqinia sp. A32]|uniref:hypothetical protein n=1 Tax=Sunxiuqinia sp. A32 TaxID=3461496 RepID=UPI0040460362